MSQHTEEHQDFQNEARRETSLLIGISRTIETSKITHQGTREEATRAILAKLQASHTLRVGDRGWITAFDRAGNPVSLQKLVDDAMLLDKNIGDADSIASAVKNGRIDIGAKDELKTVQQKVEFINRFGNAAWEKLPAQRVPTISDFETLTAAQLKTLPLSVKVKLTETQISNALKRR